MMRHKIDDREPWRTLNEWAAGIGMAVGALGIIVLLTAAVVVAVRQ